MNAIDAAVRAAGREAEALARGFGADERHARDCAERIARAVQEAANAVPRLDHAAQRLRDHAGPDSSQDGWTRPEQLPTHSLFGGLAAEALADARRRAQELEAGPDLAAVVAGQQAGVVVSAAQAIVCALLDATDADVKAQDVPALFEPTAGARR